MNPVSPNAATALLTAKEHLSVGPMPDWVTPWTFDPGFKTKVGTPVTELLFGLQVHAERHQRFVHVARRLESMQAVQQCAQWQLAFEPTCQTVVVHRIRIHRGDQQFEQTNIDRVRVLQREEGLDHFILDGWFTALLVLDDVRPGDIIESCYTITTRPRLLPEFCGSFLELKSETPLGKFGFSVRFDGQRPMKWKSSSSAQLAPAERREGRDVIWEWTGGRPVVCAPEANTPSWHLDFPWIQVSNFPDWSVVAAGVAAAWGEQNDHPMLDQLAKEIAGADSNALVQVERAIRMVQDEFRYLSVNLDLGGQIPAPPSSVAQRRFGDCKDLSFLLVHLLGRLGVKARPILVNMHLGRTLGSLLPMPQLFDHAIVEFTMNNTTRWVDPTRRLQGGGPLKRAVPDFGLGLPVDPDAATLIAPPHLGPSSYEMTESILLDTTGASSILAINLRVTGDQADGLRRHLETLGREKFAEERLGSVANRYSTAKRVGQLQYRDHRDANEIVMAELFQINGFLERHPNSSLRVLRLPSSIAFEAVAIPDIAKIKSRRTPLALPYPCNITHIFEVQSASLQPMAGPRSQIENAYFRFSQRQKSLPRSLSIIFNLSTLTDTVPANQLVEYANLVKRIWEESTWTVTVPQGVAHPRQPGDFGQLPFSKTAERTGSPPGNPREVAPPQTYAATPDANPPSSVQTAEMPSRPAPRNEPQTVRPVHEHSTRERARRRTRRPVSKLQAQRTILFLIIGLSLLILGYLLYFTIGVGSR